MSHPVHIVAVSGLVSNPAGQVLLVRSPKRGWEFPGGQVEVGESLTDALLREVKEETGVEITVGPLVGVYSNVSPPVKVMFGFLIDFVSGELTASEESLEVAWLSRSDAMAAISYPSYRDRLRDMLEFDGRPRFRAYRSQPYTIVEERAF